MILVTGGSSQGKREFVRQYLGEQDADGFVWTEGEKASWEEFMDGRFCRDFQLFVRRVMKGSAGPSFRAIGVTRLNFSVRNGKRWNPCAIAT